MVMLSQMLECVRMDRVYQGINLPQVYAQLSHAIAQGQANVPSKLERSWKRFEYSLVHMKHTDKGRGSRLCSKSVGCTQMRELRSDEGTELHCVCGICKRKKETTESVRYD